MFFPVFLLKIFNWRVMLYKVVLVSAVQQHESAIGCLENPRDRGAWWAAVYGVTQSQTRLKRLSSSTGPLKGLLRHSTAPFPLCENLPT